MTTSQQMVTEFSGEFAERLPLAVPPGFPQRDHDSAPRRYLRSLIAGSTPPHACLERLALPVPATATWSYGRLAAHVPLSGDLTLTPGVIFGGYVLCLIDHFASLVMMTVVPDDARVLTAAIDTSFPAPLIPGEVEMTAEVTKLSTRRALVEVSFSQDQRIASRGVVEQVIKRTAPASA